MAAIVDKLEDIEAQIAKLHAERARVLAVRCTEIGKIAERMGVLVYSDAALAGALDALVGAHPAEVKKLEAKGATFLAKRGRKPAGGGDVAGNGGTAVGSEAPSAQATPSGAE
jgi:hypothetical protein